MTSFIGRVGGKHFESIRIVNLFPQTFGDFYEPFLGAGHVFFRTYKLYGEGHSYILSDTDEHLVLLWTALQKTPELYVDEFVHLCNTHSKSRYYLRLERYEDTLDPALFWYLSRATYSSKPPLHHRVPVSDRSREVGNLIYMSRGSSVVRQVCALSSMSEVYVSCCDYEQSVSTASAGDVVFLDPPYSGASITYGLPCAFNQERLANCATSLADRGVHVYVTNYLTDETKFLYDEFNVMHLVDSQGYRLKRRPVPEVVFHNQ